MTDEPDLMERMVQLGRARQAYLAQRERTHWADRVSSEDDEYIALLEAECKRVGILFDPPKEETNGTTE